MYYIKKSEWGKLKRENPDYVGRCLITHEHNGKICRRGEGMCFEYLLPGAPNSGTALVFEHIHFEIIPG